MWWIWIIFAVWVLGYAVLLCGYIGVIVGEGLVKTFLSGLVIFIATPVFLLNFLFVWLLDRILPEGWDEDE